MSVQSLRAQLGFLDVGVITERLRHQADAARCPARRPSNCQRSPLPYDARVTAVRMHAA